MIRPESPVLPRLLLSLLLCCAPLTGLSASSGAAPVVTRTLNNGQLILEDVPEIPASLVARLQQYQEVRSAQFVDWAEDGKGMLVLTRFGELNQVHRVDFQGGARHQLTYFTEPMSEVLRQRQGSKIALTMDRGGSEFDQIFLFDPDTASSQMVSDGTSRNARLVWDKQGQRLAYQSTRRNGRSNDIWMMDIDRPESARPVLEAEDNHWWGPVDFTSDGKSLLVQHMIGATDSRIYLMDLQSGELRLLAGSAEFPSANRAATLDREDSGYFFISNARGLAAELAWQSFEPGALPEYITTSIRWDVIEFALSEDGKRGAFTTNEDGISRLYLFNARNRNYALVNNLPMGVIYGLEFHPDNRRLAMTLSTAKTPSDVFVMQMGRSPLDAESLLRWTFSEVGGLDTDTFVEPDLIRYPSFDLVGEVPRQIPAFIYKPEGKGPFPVIIYIHGGPESQYRPSFSSTIQSWIAELGAAVIAPNVRGSFGYGNDYLSLDDGVKREDAVKDIGALLDWLPTQPQLDASRVAVYGGSYGGYMVLASAVHYSERLRAAIDVVGISNFVSFLENTQDYRRDLRRQEYGDERDPEMRAFLQSISPLNHVERINLPMLVVQGQNDPRVPVSESEQIVAALRNRGQPVWYMNALNEGHGYDRKENRDAHQLAALLFLQRYLLSQEPQVTPGN
jgi:dipeptidyl aminopeptidase/acylaminoacyl peptidase